MSSRALVGTLNVAGLMRSGRLHPDRWRILARAVRETGCEMLAVQEAVAVVAADGRMVYNLLRDDLLPHLGEAWDWFFFPTVDSWLHPAPGKWGGPRGRSLFALHPENAVLRACMSRSGIPAAEWAPEALDPVSGAWWRSPAFRVQEGPAIAVRPPWGFRSLLGAEYGNRAQPRDPRAGALYAGNRHGHAVILPWYLGDDACLYRGDRDTNPRSLLLARFARLDAAGDSPEVLFGGTHLATLKEENRPDGLRVPTPRAGALRERQIACLCAYLGSLRDALPNQSPALSWVLAGDLNCTPDSPEMERFRAAGLHPLPLGWAGPGAPWTHRGRQAALDHILAATPGPQPGACVYDLGRIEGEGADRTPGGAPWASDHHLVWAEITL